MASTGLELWATISQVVIAAFTVVLAAIAIWGDAIRRWLLPPRLHIEKHNFEGDFNTTSDGKQIVYYHLKILNTGRSPAHKVRVLCAGLSRRRSDGKTFQLEQQIVPMQLEWSFMAFQELLPTVGPHRFVDLGYVAENAKCFCPSLVAYPGNFRGFVEPHETLRFKIVATADNVAEPEPFYVEVSWNGQFSSDRDEMSKHLVVKEVDSLGEGAEPGS